MKKNKLAAGLVALSVPLMMMAISAPTANAAGVSSTVTAIDKCSWSLGGFDSNLILGAPNGEKYEGAELGVSATITGLTLALSGELDETPLASSTECSFYNAEKQGQAEFALSSTADFTASYGDSNTADTDMDFTLTEGGGLDIAAALSEECTAAEFTKNDASFTAVGDLANVFLKASVDNSYDTGLAPYCAPTITVATTIPASEAAPAGAGQNYSFTGPVLTITLRDGVDATPAA